jgi:DNA-binding CsgD family transcriptional regulator
MATTDAKLVALIEDVIGLTDLEEFRIGLLEALQRALPSEYASLNDLGPGPLDATVIANPPVEPSMLEAFVRHKHENPIAAFHARTRDGRAYRFSDLITRRELRRLSLYEEVYAPLGINYQIAFTLPTAPDRLLGVALSRAQRDYTGQERELINRARPLLIQAFRNALEQDHLKSAVQRLHDGSTMLDALVDVGLSRRESQVLRGLAHGQSTDDIAAALNISRRTVTKHLEHCFRKLDVNSRSAAAAEAWVLARRGGENVRSR